MFNIIMERFYKKELPKLPNGHEMSLRDLNYISPLRETSQIPPRNISKEMTFLRRLQDLSNTSPKRCLFCDAFKTSQKHLKKDLLCVTSLRRLEHISKNTSFLWRLWDKTSLASICHFSKIPHRNEFIWFP